MHRHPDHEDPEQIAPELSKIPRMDPFRVEPGFFERFPYTVRTAIQRQRKPFFNLERPSVRVALGVVAGIALVLVIARGIAVQDAVEPGHETISHDASADLMGTDDPLFDFMALEDADWSAGAPTPVPALEEAELTFYLEYTGVDLHDLLASR